MSDQDAALIGRNFKNIGIRNPFEFTVRSGSEIDRWLASPDCNNDSAMDIGVSLEPDQGRGSPILARARCNLSQRSGLASDSGTVLASNSRALSSKYLSMSAL